MILTIHDSEDMQALIEKLSALSFEKGEIYEVSYKKKPRKRSVPQNRLYWLWIACIADETGNDREDIHRVLAGKFLPSTVVEVMGEKVRRVASTSSLDKEAFTAYLDKIAAFVASELGITLTSPEDRFYAQFEEYYKNSL